MSTISLGNIRPEGITAGPDGIMYITNLFYGGIRRLDVATGTVAGLVPDGPYFAKLAIGLAYYADGDALIVAGAGSRVGLIGNVTVYDAASGIELIACGPSDDDGPADFLNDVTMIDDIAYVTDSGRNRLMTMNVTAALVAGECDVGSVVLPEADFTPANEGDFIANGTYNPPIDILLRSFQPGLTTNTTKHQTRRTGRVREWYRHCE
jgi:DNA-binding beta-propeller fold protein YncE